MPKGNAPLFAFNRGMISPMALARVDIQRAALSAEEMTNWLPKTLGPMSLRPGMQYLGASRLNKKAAWIDFVARTTDTAALEITDGQVRVWVDDALVTRPSVSTSISNGNFATSSGWTDNSSGAATLAYGGSGLILDAPARGGVAEVIRQVTVAAGDQNVEHALAINVTRGPVTFRVGSASGGDQYIPETILRSGRHSLAFTPTGDFHLTIRSTFDGRRIVASIAVESSGVMTVTAPWAEADLDLIRWAQSADVVFVACDGYKPYRIERRNNPRSWSVVEYLFETGPFFPARSKEVKLRVAATRGNTTMTASKPFFRSTHVGALFRLTHTGQGGAFVLGSADDAWTDPIRVTGVKNTGKDGGNTPFNDRDWAYTITGTWNGTIRVQRSTTREDTGFVDFPRNTGETEKDIVNNRTGRVQDGDNNQNIVAWYRMGFASYSSGSAAISITYDGGARSGVVRVTAYNSPTSVDVEVIKPLSRTKYTKDWQEGMWSAEQGWPTAAEIYEGRLWWMGPAYLFGSVSDDFENFDQNTEGDAGPIIRSVGYGPVDAINFSLGLQRLIVGTDGSEVSVRSSNFDEPLTPTNMMAKDCSTQGSARVRAVKVDTRGIFVQRSGKRIYELAYDFESNDYRPRDLTLIARGILDAGVTGIAVRRQPDTQLFFPLVDGTVAVLNYDPAEELACWSIVTTDGAVEKVFVLPGADEDDVYFHVRRTINGATVRYVEKLASADDCVGGTLNLQADAFVTVSQAASTTVSGLSHLEGEAVIVWADGADRSPDAGAGDASQTTYTVSGGAITLGTAAAEIVVGLPYAARFKSSKLAYAAAAGTALVQPKKVNRLGVILADTHNDGLEYGGSFDTMQRLPRVYQGAEIGAGTVYSAFDEPSFEFPGEWKTDARLCLRAVAPRPCTALAAIVDITPNDKIG